MFRQTQKDKHSRARTGIITTDHGSIETPAFIPVGTQATVKSLTTDDLNTLGVQMFFVNTYHMYLRPGMPVIKKFGGLHRFMGWEKPVITDSGGFQVFSLAKGDGSRVKITEHGVEFRSHWDGSAHLFTPESSMEWQAEMGSDIHIAFDDCTPYGKTKTQTRASMERTHRWAKRSLAAHSQGALYGVIQGGVFKDLREESARYIGSLPFDGIAIGGVSVGESKTEMRDVLSWVAPLLPADKPRHLLGVGEIDDIFAAVAEGMDTFDCVQPTRLARVGMLFTKRGTVDITKAAHAKKTTPVETGCRCYTCTHVSAGYVHHLFRVRELLAYRLATIHNIHFVNSLLSDIRAAIRDGSFVELKKQWRYNS